MKDLSFAALDKMPDLICYGLNAQLRLAHLLSLRQGATKIAGNLAGSH